MIYDYTIYPIEYIYKIFYLFFKEYTHSYGIALVLLSLLTCLITKPLMKWAATLSKDEQNVKQHMDPQLKKIKIELKGAEQHRAIQRLYKRYAYHPVMAVRSVVAVLLQLPFLMAAYYMLSNLQEIRGVEWLVFKDLGKPDSILGTINVMPFVMTGINLLSAFSTTGFGKKERIQSLGIATLFLVLLYNAPCSLLLYWSFNNFWTLVGNIFDIVVKNLVWVQRIINETFIRGIFKSTYDYQYICFALAFTGAFAVPLDIYLNNISEFWFKMEQIVPWFFIWVIVAYLLFSSINFLVSSKYRQHYLTLLFGILLGLTAQSYFINLDYGVLNGESIDWNKYKVQGVINTIVWAVCIVVPFFIRNLIGSGIFFVNVNKICLGLVLSQIVSLAYVYSQISDIHKKSEATEYNYVLTSDRMFELSNKENMIVFVLDCFDNTIFDEILKNEPWVKDELVGFTYYPDATSVNGGTDTALPHILTGIEFKNNMTVKEYVSDAWYKTKFFNVLNKNKYDSRIYTYSSFVASTTDNINNLKRTKLVNRVSKNVLKKYIKLSLFREVPHFFKKKFVVYSDDITRNPNKVIDKKIKPYKQNDLDFYKRLKKGITLSDSNNAFRLYHLRGPHPPHSYNSNLKSVKQSNFYEQGLGSLKIVFEYLNQLKKKKIYDNTVFAIIADHGYWDKVAHGPIVCFKKFNSFDRELAISNNPISLDDLHSSLIEKYITEDSEYNHPFWAKQNGDKRYVYFRGKDLALNEWLVYGDMKDKTAWKLNRTIEFNGELSRTYTVGSTVKFTSFGDGVNFLKSGWKGMDIEGTYSQRGSIPCLEFNLNSYLSKDITMLVRLRITDKVTKNDDKVTFIINDDYTNVSYIKEGFNDICIKIPKEYIGGPQISVQFKLNDSRIIKICQINFDWCK